MQDIESMTRKERRTRKQELERQMRGKQRLFCFYYMELDYNGAGAAREAGYSENTAREIAHDNLSKGHIKDYIAILEQERVDRLCINVDSIIQDVETIKAMAIDADDHSNALRATENLAKFKGMFTEKIQIGEIEESEEELNRKLANIRKKSNPTE